MSRKVVHVIGTGTIGEPLIGLLCDFKEDLGVDEIYFHKNTMNNRRELFFYISSKMWELFGTRK